jgi:sugar O-acyltransferase (sialic acid O-acetyltransferase NeuD family)
MQLRNHSVAIRRSRLLVLGAGGHGRMVADVARSAGFEVVGYADLEYSNSGRPVDDYGKAVIIEQTELLRRVARRDVMPADADSLVLAIGQNTARHRLLCSIRRCFPGDWPACVSDSIQPRFLLPVVVHPTAAVSVQARLGPGTVVMPMAVVNAGADIGDAVIVNSAAVVEHECTLSSCVHVSPGSILSGGVRVGERAWIGAGATIIQGIRIGRDAVVGAGAVVIRDVADGETVVGVPAHTIRRGQSSEV